MKVWPRTDEIRKVLYHPTGAHFPAEGPVDWPEDSYTARRIADGDVTTEAPVTAAAAKKPSRPEPRHET